MVTVSIEDVSSSDSSIPPIPNKTVKCVPNRAPTFPRSLTEDGFYNIVCPPHTNVQQIQRPPLIPNTCSVASVCSDDKLFFAVIMILTVAFILILLIFWLIISGKFHVSVMQ